MALLLRLPADRLAWFLQSVASPSTPRATTPAAPVVLWFFATTGLRRGKGIRIRRSFRREMVDG